MTPKITIGFCGAARLEIRLTTYHVGETETWPNPAKVLKHYPAKPSSIILEDAVRLAREHKADLSIQAEAIPLIDPFTVQET